MKLISLMIWALFIAQAALAPVRRGVTSLLPVVVGARYSSSGTIRSSTPINLPDSIKYALMDPMAAAHLQENAAAFMNVIRSKLQKEVQPDFEYALAKGLMGHMIAQSLFPQFYAGLTFRWREETYVFPENPRAFLEFMKKRVDDCVSGSSQLDESKEEEDFAHLLSQVLSLQDACKNQPQDLSSSGSCAKQLQVE